MNIQIFGTKRALTVKKQSGILRSGGIKYRIYRYEGKRAQQRRI